MQNFGSLARKVVAAAEIALPLEVIHEAQGFANIEKRSDVQAACGRILMAKVAGRNQNYDIAVDVALVREYLHGAAVEA